MWWIGALLLLDGADPMGHHSTGGLSHSCWWKGKWKEEPRDLFRAKLCFPVLLMHVTPADSSQVRDAGLGAMQCWWMQPEAEQTPAAKAAMRRILQFYLKWIKAPKPGQ